jgi:hypothetical protein
MNVRKMEEEVGKAHFKTIFAKVDENKYMKIVYIDLMNLLI